MRHLRHVLGAAAVVATASTMLAAPAFATSAAENYAALGDSYASGVGSREYFDDSGDCLRSPKAYAQLWADANGVTDFNFAACSGAVTDDVNANQLDGLSADTTLVTISVGGNDVGFASVIQDCLLGSDDKCDSAVGAGEDKARNELPAKLDTTYANIREAAPNAKVVVLGYPRLTTLGNCGVPFFSDAKRQRINDGSDVLAGVISERAEAAGFTYADTRDAFDGHGVCAGEEWINGPSNPLVESFHPNVDGYAKGYLPVLNSVTG